MKFTGVSGIVSAAHRSREGNLHGHTWQVVAWWLFSSDVSAESRKTDLLDYLSFFDHSLLADTVAWGEDLAERIGEDLDAVAVDVSRPLEGFYAKWVRD